MLGRDSNGNQVSWPRPRLLRRIQRITEQMLFGWQAHHSRLDARALARGRCQRIAGGTNNNARRGL